MDVSSTAAVLTSIASVTPQDLLVLGASVVLAFLMAPATQATVEGAIAAMLPGWAFFAKPFIPSILASAVAYLANLKGLPGVDAVVGALVLSRATHWLNAQPWSADFEGKFPKVWELFKGFAPKGPAILLALLLGAATAHADWAASVGGLLGSQAWDIGDGGTWSSTQSTIAGGELSLAYGSTDAQGKFTPLFVLLGGIGGENQGTKNYMSAQLGGGAIIPGTTTPLVAAVDWRLFSGKPYPGVTVAATYAFGDPFWRSK